MAAAAALVVLLGSCSPAVSSESRTERKERNAQSGLLETIAGEQSRLAAVLVAGAIRQSRDDALRAGTREVPQNVWRTLGRSDPELRKVRWRINHGELGIATAFAGTFDEYCAITFEDVIVFCNAQSAGDPYLWAHELEHVRQYQRFGIDGFAIAYVNDRAAIEGRAEKRAIASLAAQGRGLAGRT